MAYAHGAVYNPPKDGLPLVLVVFGRDNEVIAARKVPTREAGELLLATALFEDQQKYGQDTKS